MKRNGAVFMIVMILFSMWAFSFTANAGDRVMVPYRLQEIRNPRFKVEISSFAPNYDAMSRSEQVRAYTRAYRALNYGEYPSIYPDENTHDDFDYRITAPTVLLQERSADQIDAGYVQRYIEGYGYRRQAVRSTPTQRHEAARTPSYVSGLDGEYGGLRVGERGITGGGYPPYAGPYVADQHKAPQVRAGTRPGGW